MSSRFKGIFDTAKETENKKAEKPKSISKPTNAKKEVAISPILSGRPNRKKGNGKSSNPNYTQALAYVRKETLQEVKEKLFYNPSQDFSDLIESLLSDWVKKQK